MGQSTSLVKVKGRGSSCEFSQKKQKKISYLKMFREKGVDNTSVFPPEMYFKSIFTGSAPPAKHSAFVYSHECIVTYRIFTNILL